MQYYGYGTYGVEPVPQLQPRQVVLGGNPNANFPERIDPSRQFGLNETLGLIGTGVGAVNPLLGAAIGYGGNLLSHFLEGEMQKSNQKSLMAYQADLNSPMAMMKRMQEAGINPAAAAQGIAGAPGAGAVAGGSAQIGNGTPSLIDTLAGAENTALNADVLKALTKDYEASANLKDSQNIGQLQENAWYDTKQLTWLRGAVADNRIKESTANMLEEDEFYHGAEAYEHFMQTMTQTQIMAQDLKNKGQEFLNKCAEYYLIMTEAGLNEAQRQECFSRIGVNNAMIGEIESRTRNIDADTLIKGEQLTQEQITTDMMGMKKEYEEYFLNSFRETGYFTGSSTNDNYIRLAMEGRVDDATELMSQCRNFTKGQYGAKGDQARKWISGITGAIATIGGVALMFVPGAQLGGAALTAYGVNKTGKAFAGDSGDYSHIFD